MSRFLSLGGRRAFRRHGGTPEGTTRPTGECRSGVAAACQSQIAERNACRCPCDGGCVLFFVIGHAKRVAASPQITLAGAGRRGAALPGGETPAGKSSPYGAPRFRSGCGAWP